MTQVAELRNIPIERLTLSDSNGYQNFFWNPLAERALFEEFWLLMQEDEAPPMSTYVAYFNVKV